jgi:1-phosphofructokinase
MRLNETTFNRWEYKVGSLLYRHQSTRRVYDRLADAFGRTAQDIYPPYSLGKIRRRIALINSVLEYQKTGSEQALRETRQILIELIHHQPALREELIEITRMVSKQTVDSGPDRVQLPSSVFNIGEFMRIARKTFAIKFNKTEEPRSIIGGTAIVTLTLNPTINTIIDFGKIRRGEGFGRVELGGKGVLCSRVLRRLGIGSIPVLCAGPRNRELFVNLLHLYGVKPYIKAVAADTREYIIFDPAKDIVVVGPNPVLTRSEINELLNNLPKLLKNAKFLVLGGQLPDGVSSALYAHIIRIASRIGVKTFLDARGDALKYAVLQKPDVIRINLEEFAELVKLPVAVLMRNDYEVLQQKMKELVDSGIEIVIVSLHEKGAFMVTSEGTYQAYVPKTEVKNRVGAGDSMLAGLILSYLQEDNDLEAFKYAVAAGTASVADECIGLKNQRGIDALLSKIRIEISS